MAISLKEEIKQILKTDANGRTHYDVIAGHILEAVREMVKQAKPKKRTPRQSKSDAAYETALYFHKQYNQGLDEYEENLLKKITN